MLSLCTGCGSSAPETEQQAHEELVWYLPSAGSYKATPEVTAAINEKIHQTYPSINIDFRFINIYEYPEKIAVYLSAGEQADIVWANDGVLPFINYPSENIYKFLDASIQTSAPNIRARLELDDEALYKIYDKNYFIPVINHSSGLIPFLKIPRELEHLIDRDALLAAVNANETAGEELFQIINEYLGKASSAGSLHDGIDFAAVSKIFPMIGYEAFISTNELIVSRIDDTSHTAADMLSTESCRLSYEMYEYWRSKGYIKENTPIIYKSDFASDYSYIMSGAWGYKTSDGYSMVMDKHTEDYIYIALDSRYHTTKLFTESVAIIPADGDHTESALNVLDLFYSDPELYNLITFGLEGTHYERTGDGCARLLSDEYKCFENIVPRAAGALTSVCTDSVYPADMRPASDSVGMKIPSSSKEFRRMLFDYIDTYYIPVYSTAYVSNNGSEIGGLLDIYNGVTTLD